MSARAKVEAAYLENPTALASEIAEATGLTVKQVRSARSPLVASGRLPAMYGYGGAMSQNDPAVAAGYKNIFDQYKVFDVSEVRAEYAIRCKSTGTLYAESADSPLEALQLAVANQPDPGDFEVVHRYISSWKPVETTS